MQPSDSLAPFGRGFGSPCPRPTPMRALVLGRPRVRPRTRGTSETDHRLSASPVAVEEKRGPPRFLGRPLRACRGRTPRRIRPLLAPTPLRGDRGEAVVAFRQNRTLGIRDDIDFEAANPTAHTLACLRFAGLVAGAGARLATGSGGLTPGRTGFAPAGRQTKFHGVIASSIPLRPAGPGRTVCLTPGRRPPSPASHLAPRSQASP